MNFSKQIKTALNSILNKLFGADKTQYSPEYVRSKNYPNNKLSEVLREADAARNSNK